MMNRENEEQRPISQTLCGALQKEPNCKCLVLTVLIYGCLAAVTWCRCANVTKIMVNYTKFPIRSTKHVSSPCDDGYIYIPVAFMGMLYLVYLVECYHSPIRIDLLHAESQDSVLSKLAQLKMAQPRIWWKAVSYHYVRRKRQITRYRNGDNYTTTQVYYERVNTHSATSHYYYEYCGVKDISKELILESKIPITKILLTKGFAFSNVRSATEFEEARSRFFAEQELSDDYMEMREGLDLGYNVNKMLVAVFGNPWFTNSYVYWCLSALLLSWPLRVMIEYNTQYVEYQVTKLFGVNYDTPISSEPIHASMSQLSQPGSYMLAPSYSEALLMDPVTSCNDETERNWQTQGEADIATNIIPSYSEALLYERAKQFDHRNMMVNSAVGSANDAITITCNDNPNRQILPLIPCECHCPCPCHENTNCYKIKINNDHNYIENATGTDHVDVRTRTNNTREVSDVFENELATLRTTADGRLRPPEIVNPCSMNDLRTEASPSRCGSCGRMSTSTQTINSDAISRASVRNRPSESSQTLSKDFALGAISKKEVMPRDISEPNLKTRTESMNAFLPKENVRSLENILENEKKPTRSNRVDVTVAEVSASRVNNTTEQQQKRLPTNLPPVVHRRSPFTDEASHSTKNTSKGAIPKTELRNNRITVNPMSNEACWKLPNSKTYLCLKSMLKQNKRRYTLVTADEFQNLTDQDAYRGFERGLDTSIKSDWNTQLDNRSRFAERLNSRRRLPSFEEFVSARDKMMHANDHRSPIQEVFPGDPFGGKNIVPVRNLIERNTAEDIANASANTQRPIRSPVDRNAQCKRFSDDHAGEQVHVSAEPFRFDEHPSSRIERGLHYLLNKRFSVESSIVDVDTIRANTNETCESDTPLPPYSGIFSDCMNRRSSSVSSSTEHNDRSQETNSTNNLYSPRTRRQLAGLTRSFTERRRSKVARFDRNFRRSFTGRVEDYRTEHARRANFSMETSL
ncbi:uncharacterized protein LOC109860339 isoform X2 [Pseudomyrmex gracilis]|uniref:uncharacterized protein LOC109860339 isoform X2 n=1 Tax=Pseudomyrmex gracilis TaxID=219809 RepID=UPI000994E22D|nr:uncharacterized protein LOC109860339 isoform X2 [Pseudomyrmex gracilis]